MFISISAYQYVHILTQVYLSKCKCQHLSTHMWQVYGDEVMSQCANLMNIVQCITAWNKLMCTCATEVILKTRPTLEHQTTLSHLRSISPTWSGWLTTSPTNDRPANFWKMFFFFFNIEKKKKKKTLKSGVISGWTEKSISITQR